MSCPRERDICCEPRHDQCESIERQNYDCGVDRKVIKYQHIVRHQHDIINEYDVIHEHHYNYYDVVKTRETEKHNDHRKHKPDYCRNGECREFVEENPMV